MERAVVQIIEVDIEQRRVTVADKNNRQFQLDYPFTGAAEAVPAPGEIWGIYRDNGYHWFLDKRRDNGEDRVGFATLAPGDTRVRAANTLHLDAGKLLLNGQQMGVTTWEKKTVILSQTDVPLAHTPISIKTVQVFFGGALIDPSGISLTATGLHFTTPLSAGSIIVYYQYQP